MSGIPESQQIMIDAILHGVEQRFGTLGFVCITKVMDCIRNTRPASSEVAIITAPVVDLIFDYWKKVMSSPKSVLDANRKGLIIKALKLYSPADVCKAIRGCSKTPHNMGDNPQKTKYNGLNLILRNAEYIDKFIALDAGIARATMESAESKNSRLIAEALGTVPDDGRTLDMEA